MFTLGINAAFHDSAACLVKDGKVLAAAEDERFTRIKHGKRPVPFTAYELPYHAIDYCLRHAGISLADVDHVAYSYDPSHRLGTFRGSHIPLPMDPSAAGTREDFEAPWDPLFLSYLVNAPRQLRDGYPHHLQKTFRSKASPRFRWHYVTHHLAHAASAYLVSPFDEAAIMTLDGRGESATTSYGIGRAGKMTKIGDVHMPHSLGLLYEELTTYLGFLHSSDEYKVMALASYGKPTYAHQLADLIMIEGEGRYTVRPHSWEEMFGPARERGGPMEQKHFDLARSMQAVLEDTVLELARWLHGRTSAENLCLAGGVALNCVMNARLRDRGPFKDIWVQPAAGDAGTALGAALHIDAKEGGHDGRRYRMEHAYLGPEYLDDEIKAVLDRGKVRYETLGDVPRETARVLKQDKIIGWFQGRMEFGPRALGSRSILASPISSDMQERLNDIKDREDFRPVAPVVLEEEAASWFKGARRSPFMLFVYDVLKERETRIPAVRHVDGTARIQTVNAEQNLRYYRLLKAFQEETGVPVLINTSFNTRSKPIVCTPQDALECFITSPLDALVIGSYLVTKG